ncbi:MAG: hypothetical protein SFW67_35560 [Myxococcaceae bacterium]|nr:hypothetical protein [Myxococcaceae bacterium]
MSSAAGADVADADILQRADLELEETLLPSVVSVREDFLLRYLDVEAAQNRIRLPPRSVYGAVRLVQVAVTGQVGYRRLERLSLSDGAHYESAAAVAPAFGAWYFDGGGIRLVGLSGNPRIRVWYQSRPGQLALVSACDAVTSLPGQPSALYAAGIEGQLGRTTTTVVSPVDVISKDSAHQYVLTDGAMTGSTTARITGWWDDFPQVGDYICPAGQTCVVPLPEQLGGTLVEMVAARILEEKGYPQGAQMRERALAALQRALTGLTPRASGNPQGIRRGVLQRIGGAW